MKHVSLNLLAILCAIWALVSADSQAQSRSRPCGCYCNVWLPAPCSDNACKAACGYVDPRQGGSVPQQGGGPITPIPDLEAERRAQEEAQRKREEDERIEAERLKAERDRKFKEERDAAAKGLKGAAPSSGNSNTFGLKGASSSASELRAADPRVDRDLTGQRAAWKQIHCAASILTPALAALKPPDGAPIDFNEYRYLANEALNALNGQRLGVQCAPAPEMPRFSGRAPDMDRVIASQRRLIERANVAVNQLEKAVNARPARTPDEERIAQIYAQQQANAAAIDKKIAPIREQQRQINIDRQRKAGQAKDPSAQEEARARKALDRIAQVSKKIEQGQDFGVDFDDKKPADSRATTSRRPDK